MRDNAPPPGIGGLLGTLAGLVGVGVVKLATLLHWWAIPVLATPLAVVAAVAFVGWKRGWWRG